MQSTTDLVAPQTVAPPAQPEDEYAFLDRTGGAETERKGQQDPQDGHLHGFVYGMIYEDYAKVDALNASRIVHMRRSPMYYRWAIANQSPETAATMLGTLIHRLVLEPDVKNEIAVWKPEEKMERRYGKKWDAYVAANAGKQIITEKEYEQVMETSTCALSHQPIARYANSDGPTEVCMFWRHPYTGRRMKARLDKLIPEGHIIFDLKSTYDCQSYRFGAISYRLGYHIKIAHYAEGYEVLTGHKPTCRIGAIEKNPPHESTVYRITDDVLIQGKEELERLVERITACEYAEAELVKKKLPASRAWPAEVIEETDLMLPTWAQYADFGDESL
jgi:exodeoxyribonuclease VIII